MRKPHKHAEVIKAWADGKAVQYRYSPCEEWYDLTSSYPNWMPEYEYRIKPEPKPDYEETVTLFRNSAFSLLTMNVEPRWLANGSHYKVFGSFKVTFDGETGEFKSIEVLR